MAHRRKSKDKRMSRSEEPLEVPHSQSKVLYDESYYIADEELTSEDIIRYHLDRESIQPTTQIEYIPGPRITFWSAIPLEEGGRRPQGTKGNAQGPRGGGPSPNTNGFPRSQE